MIHQNLSAGNFFETPYAVLYYDNNTVIISFAENTVQELRLFHDSFNVSSEAILLHFM